MSESHGRKCHSNMSDIAFLALTLTTFEVVIREAERWDKECESMSKDAVQALERINVALKGH